MSRAQREKGKRGERMWRDVLREHGFRADRAGYKQTGGGWAEADVESPDLTDFFAEVKFVEKLNVRQAFRQAEGNAPIGKIPYVAHKTSAEQWLVTLSANDFLTILRRSDFAAKPNKPTQES